jgi:hypothetical protein
VVIRGQRPGLIKTTDISNNANTDTESMKLTIDTTEKTVTVDSDTPLGEVIGMLKKLMPDGEWMEYKIVAGEQGRTYAPYPIQPQRWPEYPMYPDNPIITWQHTGDPSPRYAITISDHTTM